jgi:hypothetical protein
MAVAVSDCVGLPYRQLGRVQIAGAENFTKHVLVAKEPDSVVGYAGAIILGVDKRRSDLRHRTRGEIGQSFLAAAHSGYRATRETQVSYWRMGDLGS